MDDLFVARRAPCSKKQPVNRHGAQRLIQEVAAEIDLDQVPDAMTPDERKLRAVGTGQEAPAQGHNGALVDTLFAQRRPEARQEIQEGLADALFCKRATEPCGLSPELEGMADALFSRKAEEEPEPACDVEDAPQAPETREPRTRCACKPPKSPLGPLASLGALLSLAALVLVTLGLLMGCQERPLLGRFCLAPGPPQWLLTAAPATLLLASAFCSLWHRYRTSQREQVAAWRHDGEAQKSAAALLEALLTAPADERHKYARQVVQILRDFPEKAVLQQKACLALDAICRARKGNPATVKSAGAVPLVLLALESHLRVRAVQQAGLAALACLAKISKSEIFDLGGIPVVLASMAKFKRDPHVQISGAMALGALCINSSANRASVVKYGGLSALLVALERHSDEANVIIAASETMAILVNDAGTRKKLLTAATTLQNVVATCEAACSDRPGEFDVALGSLRKLESRIGVHETAAPVDDDSDCYSEADVQQEAVQANAHQAFELQSRLEQWKASKKPKTR